MQSEHFYLKKKEQKFQVGKKRMTEGRDQILIQKVRGPVIVSSTRYVRQRVKDTIFIVYCFSAFYLFYYFGCHLLPARGLNNT